MRYNIFKLFYANYRTINRRTEDKLLLLTLLNNSHTYTLHSDQILFIYLKLDRIKSWAPLLMMFCR